MNAELTLWPNSKKLVKCLKKLIYLKFSLSLVDICNFTFAELNHFNFDIFVIVLKSLYSTFSDLNLIFMCTCNTKIPSTKYLINNVSSTLKMKLVLHKMNKYLTKNVCLTYKIELAIPKKIQCKQFYQFFELYERFTPPYKPYYQLSCLIINIYKGFYESL